MGANLRKTANAMTARLASGEVKRKAQIRSPLSRTWRVEAATISAGAGFLSFNLGGVEWHVSVSHIHAGYRFSDDLRCTTVTDYYDRKGAGLPVFRLRPDDRD